MRPPKLHSRRLLGHFRTAFFGSPLPMFAAARELGPVVRLRMAHKEIVTVTTPEAARHVLVEDPTAYSKDTNGNRTLALVLGDGLLTIDHGETWRRHRRMANPVFRRERIASFADTMTRASLDLCRSTPEGVHETGALTRALALRIAGETLFSSDVSAAADRMGQAVEAAFPQMLWFSSVPFDGYASLPTPGNRRFWGAVKMLDTIVYDVIRQRRQAESPGDDLLGLFMEAEEDGRRLTDAQLRDELLVMLMAGHETVATSLMWTLYLLAQHPEIQARVHTEIADDAPPSGLLSRVIQESLRLLPPIWLLGRRTVRPVSPCGFDIPAGTPVTLCTWALHRHPDVWPDPDRFDPDRWIDLEPAPTAWLPFGAGPRKCIGDRFAQLEATLALTHLIRHFRFEPVDTTEPELVANITLRPRGGMPLRWHRR